MRRPPFCTGLIVAVFCSICLSDSAFGQAVTRSSTSGNTQVSGNRSVSFLKDGKRVSITENGNGISVTVNGNTVRAKDAEQLRREYPEAFRLYVGHIGAANYKGIARGAAGGKASGTVNQTGSDPESSSSSDQKRSISVVENGRKIVITEDDKGITVSSRGKRVRAKDAAELKQKSPEAFGLYARHLQKADAIDVNAQPDANAFMRAELIKLREQNAGNPQLRSVIENMLREVQN